MKVVKGPKKQPFLDYVRESNTHWDAKQIFEAYSDCLPEHVDAFGAERNLRFFSTTALTMPEAIRVMEKCVPHGYNEFETEKAFNEIKEVFGIDTKIHIAREGSVCLYVKPSACVWLNRRSKIETLSADEVSFDSQLNMFRLWWD